MDDFDSLLSYLEASKTSVQIATVKGVKKAGMLIQSDAKRLAPVDTGRLRNSIAVEAEETAAGAVAEVGSNVIYAPYVEYGTGQRGDPSVDHRQDWLGTPPHPFLRPAAEYNRENCAIVIGEEVKKVLK